MAIAFGLVITCGVAISCGVAMATQRKEPIFFVAGRICVWLLCRRGAPVKESPFQGSTTVSRTHSLFCRCFTVVVVSGACVRMASVHCSLSIWRRLDGGTEDVSRSSPQSSVLQHVFGALLFSSCLNPPRGDTSAFVFY